MKVYVTVRHNFNAGHRLAVPSRSDQENLDLYGKCSLPSGHGHNYVVEVTLEGEVDPGVGAFVNAEELRRWLWDEVLEPIDHRNLNRDVRILEGLVPTSENLARAIFRALERGPYGRWLYQVKLHESENNVAICRNRPGDGEADRPLV